MPSFRSASGTKATEKAADKRWLCDKGRIYGRYLDLFGQVDATLNDGFSRNPELEDEDYTHLYVLDKL